MILIIFILCYQRDDKQINYVEKLLEEEYYTILQKSFFTEESAVFSENDILNIIEKLEKLW